MKQIGLALNLSARQTRKQVFLEQMEQVVPWQDLVQLIAPYDPQGRNGRPPFELQAFGAQQVVDGGQHLLGQLVALQAVAKAQDGALVRQPPVGIELGKVSVQGRVKQGFLHPQIRPLEPLLQEVQAQHRLQLKGRTPVPALGVVRGNQLHQVLPGHDLLHLFEEGLFAGLARAQVQGEAGLLHGWGGCQRWLTATRQMGRFCRISLRQHREKNAVLRPPVVGVGGVSARIDHETIDQIQAWLVLGRELVSGVLPPQERGRTLFLF